MKIKEIKNKSSKELQSLLTDKAVALRTFRFAVSGSNTRNVKEGKALKRDIARIKTVLNDVISKELPNSDQSHRLKSKT